MKKIKVVTSVLCAALLGFSAFSLTSCGNGGGGADATTVMNVSLNPEVEFVLDANNKVVSVNALNEDGNLVISASAFENIEGKTAEEAAKLVIPDYPMGVNDHIGSGSTDMGDLAAVMPVVHPYCGGARGKGHGNDYEIVDPVAACVDCAKWQVAMLTLLLKDGGALASKIAAEYNAPFKSKEEYLAYIDELNCQGDRIEYRDDGTAVLR
jgi:hypothetical protein